MIKLTPLGAACGVFLEARCVCGILGPNEWKTTREQFYIRIFLPGDCLGDLGLSWKPAQGGNNLPQCGFFREALGREDKRMFVRIGAAECVIILLLVLIVVGGIWISIRLRRG